MESKQIEKHSNSSDNDLFANVSDDVVEQILGYLPLKDKIKLEGVSKQWQTCIFKRQTIIKVTNILDEEEDNDSLNKLLKPIVVCDFARGYAHKVNNQEIRKDEFEYVLKRCKMTTSVELNCYIDDSVLQLIGSYLDGLESLKCAMFGITEIGFLEFGRNYGHKLETLNLDYSDPCDQYIRAFLKHCPNITLLDIFKPSEYIIEDKEFLPKLEDISVDVDLRSVEEDIENLRIISEKYNQTIKEFKVTVDQFERRAFEYVIKSVESVKALSLTSVTANNSDDNEKNIDHYIAKLSENCGQLNSLKIILNVMNDRCLPWNLFDSFAKFSSITTLEISIQQTYKLIDCKCECFKLCANLKHLKLSYTQISDEFFTDIGKHLPNLRSIDLDSKYLFTDHAMISMSELEKLKKVWIRQSHVANRFITDIGVCQLINACTRIEYIHLSATPRITNTTINTLKAIALQRNRIKIKFRCGLSQDRDERQFHPQIDNNRLTNLPKNLKIEIGFNEQRINVW